MIYRIAMKLAQFATKLADMTRPTPNELEDKLIRIANGMEDHAEAARARGQEAIDASNLLDMQAHALYCEAQNFDTAAQAVYRALGRCEQETLFS
jgi:hypothetical protein